MSEAESVKNDLSRLSLVDPPYDGEGEDARSTSTNYKKCGSSSTAGASEIEFVDYQDESQLAAVMSLVGRDLSEPYSIFTYRYFLCRFPNLCILAVDRDSKEPIGCVVAKIDYDNAFQQGGLQQGGESSVDTSTSKNTTTTMTGYIGMLAVSQSFRRKGIGKALVQKVIQRMKDMGCTSVTLETEVTNLTAQQLYQDIFGFVREELLVRYYLNWNDAYRLRLWF